MPISVCDLGAVGPACEMCETQPIRYVHTMRHPEWERALNVGYTCTVHMSAGYDGASFDKRLRNRAERRVSWLSREWRTTGAGNLRLSTDGRVFVVGRRPSGWFAMLIDVGADTFIGDRKTFDTIIAAKLALFDHVWPAQIRFSTMTAPTPRREAQTVRGKS